MATSVTYTLATQAYQKLLSNSNKNKKKTKKSKQKNHKNSVNKLKNPTPLKSSDH